MTFWSAAVSSEPPPVATLLLSLAPAWLAVMVFVFIVGSPLAGRRSVFLPRIAGKGNHVEVGLTNGGDFFRCRHGGCNHPCTPNPVAPLGRWCHFSPLGLRRRDGLRHDRDPERDLPERLLAGPAGLRLWLSRLGGGRVGRGHLGRRFRFAAAVGPQRPGRAVPPRVVYLHGAHDDL